MELARLLMGQIFINREQINRSWKILIHMGGQTCIRDGGLFMRGGREKIHKRGYINPYRKGSSKNWTERYAKVRMKVSCLTKKQSQFNTSLPHRSFSNKFINSLQKIHFWAYFWQMLQGYQQAFPLVILKPEGSVPPLIIPESNEGKF